MSDSSIKTPVLVNFGNLGSVKENKFELEDVEVFAKYQNSVNGDGGPHYTDDCNLSAPNGQTHPCYAVTFLP